MAEDLGTTAADAAPVLRLLLDGQPRTRNQLMDLTGLARSTVTGRLETLLALEFVVPHGEAASTGGRPPARFRFNPAARLVVAADVGATHLTVALANLTGEIVDSTTVAQNIADGPEIVLSALAEHARVLLERTGSTMDRPRRHRHRTTRPGRAPHRPAEPSTDHARLGLVRRGRAGSPRSSPARCWSTTT